MLNTKLLNGIIIASIALLFVALFINPPFKDKSNIVLQLTPTPYPTNHTSPLPSGFKTSKIESTPVTCDHPYFPLKKGIAQNYKLSVLNSKKKNIPAIFFTNTVLQASGSSATIATSIKNEKTTSKQKITCKSDGIYGFPFMVAILKSDAGTKKQKIAVSNFENITQNILLIPDQNTLTNKKKWTTSIKLEKLSLPIRLHINGVTTLQKAENIHYKQTVLPTFGGISLPNMGAEITIETKVVKNVGIIQYKIDMTDKKEKTTLQLDLL